MQTNRFAMGKLADRYSKEQEQLVHQIIAYKRSGLNFKQIADKLNELNINQNYSIRPNMTPHDATLINMTHNDNDDNSQHA